MKWRSRQVEPKQLGLELAEQAHQSNRGSGWNWNKLADDWLFKIV
jgi:hypothetical protein